MMRACGKADDITCLPLTAELDRADVFTVENGASGLSAVMSLYETPSSDLPQNHAYCSVHASSLVYATNVLLYDKNICKPAFFNL